MSTQLGIQKLREVLNDKIDNTAILGYGWFDFIVDVGSSLGLWLALSVLDILDILVDLPIFCCRIWKKISL